MMMMMMIKVFTTHLNKNLMKKIIRKIKNKESIDAGKGHVEIQG